MSHKHPSNCLSSCINIMLLISTKIILLQIFFIRKEMFDLNVNRKKRISNLVVQNSVVLAFWTAARSDLAQRANGQISIISLWEDASERGTGAIAASIEVGAEQQHFKRWSFYESVRCVSTGLPKLIQTRWKNLRLKISPNLCCSETNQHTYIEMYKVPYELDWTVCTFIIDMLNYSWTLSLLTEFTAQLKASCRLLSIHHFECRQRLKKAVQSEDQKSRKEFHIFSGNIQETGCISVSWYFPFWKKALQIF